MVCRGATKKSRGRGAQLSGYPRSCRLHLGVSSNHDSRHLPTVDSITAGHAQMDQVAKMWARRCPVRLSALKYEQHASTATSNRRIHWRYKQRQTCPDNTKYLSRVCRLSFQMQLTLDREDAFAGPFQDSRFLPEALLAEKAMPMGIFQSRWHSSDILSIIIYICIFVCYYLWISLHTLRLQALDETVASEVQQMQAGRCSRKTVRVKGFKRHYAVRTGQGLVDQPRDISTWHACFVRSTVFCNFSAEGRFPEPTNLEL